jgi:hypothetical protein
VEVKGVVERRDERESSDFQGETFLESPNLSSA